MTKLHYLAVSLITGALLGGVIFVRAVNVERAREAEKKQQEQEQEALKAANPFGEGADEIGRLDDDDFDDDEGEVEIEDEDEDEDDDDDRGGSASGGTVGQAGAASSTTSTGTMSSSSGISRATLKLHNTQADCWVAYKSVVYDITKWLPRHPGSAGAIAPYCGTAEEFAAAFTGQHGTRQDNRLQLEGTNKGALQ